MAAVDFLHQEDLPTWAGDEPATFGTEDQRQINYATQPAHSKLRYHAKMKTLILDRFSDQSSCFRNGSPSFIGSILPRKVSSFSIS
ncbi:hypothetical protein TNCV_1123481 [Trichonephila clavipes]|uniref:Uncharacterized protein n=1 Tax=Trichonephila clavipes TaxID=2585209 RepID=A0A8X6SCV2_TRICX|nr:hypothetical protein TNCV_1123481 [Trichonephila clavipes]